MEELCVAHSSAVEPSASAALTSACSASSGLTASRSDLFAAPAKRVSPAAAWNRTTSAGAVAGGACGAALAGLVALAAKLTKTNRARRRCSISENILQRKLNQSRIHRQVGDLPEVARCKIVDEWGR